MHMTESSRIIEFKKLSAAKILHLLDFVREHPGIRPDHLRENYLRSELNFPETYEFLLSISAITISGDRVFTKYAGKSVKSAKLYILELLLRKSHLGKRSISAYLKKFFVNKDIYVCKSKSKLNSPEAGIRDLLMDLGFIERDYARREYFVVPAYASLMALAINRTSLIHFETTLKNRDKLGAAAERCILEHERNALRTRPDLVKKIEHVSKIDVGAGYDILSFTLGDGGYEARFIEVKAVSRKDFAFYWTANEIETAKIHGSAYYLYLLPVSEKNKFDLKNLRIIRDPFEQLYSSRKNAELECVVFRVSPKLN